MQVSAAGLPAFSCALPRQWGSYGAATIPHKYFKLSYNTTRGTTKRYNNVAPRLDFTLNYIYLLINLI
jgi:hypothetical protein